MSSYMSFFIRGIDDTFYPIGTYCRNTAIYELFEEACFGAWEKINPVSIDSINYARHIIETEIQNWEMAIASLKLDRDMIPSFNNSLEDKLEALEDYRIKIKDYEGRLKEVEEAKSFCYFLEEIINERLYADDVNGADPNKYLYCGIEVGCSPTVDDIIE